MTGYQIRNYGIILIALVALVLILEQPFGDRSGSQEGSAVYPGFEAAQVDRITIASKGDTVGLERRAPGDWIIAGDFPMPADTSFIRKALESVSGFSTSTRVSRNADKHGIFQVDTTGARIDVYAGAEEPVASFVLGKIASGGGIYFRRVGDEDVYVSDDPVKSYFVKNERAWQNRRIFNVEPGDLTRLVVERGDSTIVFEADAESNWQLRQPEEFPVKKDEMERMLRGFARLFANSLPDSALTSEETGLDEPMLEVRAERIDGSGIELAVGKQNANGLYYCKAGDRDWIYLIAKYRVDPFYKDLHELEAEAPAPADTTGAGEEAASVGS